ncbi:MAG: hypothetical protein ABJC26_05505 [Gemmatimonadaceae bacterium]
MISYPRLLASALFCVGAVACAPARDRNTKEAPPPAAISSATSTTATSAAAAIAASTDPKSWTVTEYGIGPLRAGMTFKAAADSLKGALHADARANLNECNYVQWVDGPRGVLVMVEQGNIARVDITTMDVSTDLGARVGDTESHIQSLYPGRVRVSPHKYEDGHYLTIKAANTGDSLYRIIFETASGRVTRYRAGLMPAVEFVEGCS